MTDTAAALADDLVDALAVEMPVDSTFVGIHSHDSEMPDLSPEARKRLRDRAADLAERAAASTDPDRATLGLVAQQAESIVVRVDSCADEYVLADPIEGQGAKMLNMLPQLTPSGDKAQEDYLSRLDGVPAFYAALAQRHRDGLAAGRTPVDRMARNAIGFIDRFLSQDSPFTASLSGERADRRERIVTEHIRPALGRYRDVLATEVLGNGRDDDHPGLCHLDGGEETYRRFARMHTTTDHTPQELHDIGLDLVAKLADEYREIGGRVFGVGTAAQVQERLRTDPAMRWESAEQLIDEVRAIVARATAAAPAWFRSVPKGECVVAPVPDADAPVASNAYYMPPAPDGTRPGTYFANTYQATTRDRFTAENIAFHEAVPGHHFQIALAQEQTALHPLRTYPLVTAYAEGWGLYAERLADEMGLYSSDLMRLGMLSGDSTRAARLVVDTGLHALGWTRQQCVDYLRANTVINETEIQSETDRYIECPGQALAYMVGRLELQRLRSVAETNLGEAFDVKDFHDLVLTNGGLPLSVLADVVDDWLRTRPNG